MKIANELLSYEQQNNIWYLKTDGPIIKVMFVTDSIVRIVASFAEEFKPDASYTLVTTAWDDLMDDVLKSERRRVELYCPKAKDLDDAICLKSDQLTLKISKKPFSIDIYDQEGVLLYSELQRKAYVQDDKGRIYHYLKYAEQDKFFGFGDKTGKLNKAKKRMVIGNRDAIGYDAEFSDPLYKHIPFYIKINAQDLKATGIFYHNAYDAVFDMGAERSGYWDPYTYYVTEGGDIDLFFIYGPSAGKVVERFTDLTGKTVLPSINALGYLGSTMYYTELDEKSDEAILDFVDTARKQGMPCSGYHLSSGYTSSPENKRYVFNWNYKRFPDPQKFIADMQQAGVVVSPNIKPALLTSHPLYKEAVDKKAFILDREEQQPQLDRFWGGDGAFVDFSGKQGRAFWQQHLKESLLDIGISAIWNDNCEFEIADGEAVCQFEGHKASIASLRGVMPNLMAMTGYQAIKEAHPDKRPFLLNRAAGAGIQRYASTWTGDNSTDWRSLKFGIPIMLGLGLSGVANQGSDIGGFFGGRPSPELLVRWVQNGIFQPRFSIHSCNNDNTVTEPWMYPSYTSYIREAVKFRHKLIPYLYSLLHESSVKGSPVMRPLFYEFQTEARLLDESFDFMFGPFLLVANVVEPEADKRKVYLPQGCDWYDWDTHECYRGGQTIEVDAPLDKIPLFFKSGSIIPLAGREITNVEQDKLDVLDILIEPSADCEFLLYEDDGVSNQHEQGVFCKNHIQVTKRGKTVNIGVEKEGSYQSSVTNICLQVVNSDKAPLHITLNGSILERYLNQEHWAACAQGWYVDNEKAVTMIKYANPAGTYQMEISYEPKDLIGI